MFVVSPIVSSVQRMDPVTESDADLINAYIGGDQESGNKIFRKHYKMILQIIGEVTRGRFYSDDCLQAGAFGLYKAAHKYDASRGFKFLTMAVPWIRKYVIEEVRNEHLPAGGVAFAPRFKERLYRYVGFEVTGLSDDEIMTRMRINEAELAALKIAAKQASQPLYFSEGDDSEDGRSGIDEPLAESLEERYEEDEGFRELRDAVVAAIDDFEENEKYVLTYGLGLTGEFKSVPEIARALRISIPEFGEIRRTALFKLRRKMGSEWAQ